MRTRGRTAVGILLVALAYGCQRPNAQLTDAEMVAVEAVVEASMRAPKAPLCITASTDASSAGQQLANFVSKAPSEQFQAALVRLGNVYPPEKCPANGLQVILWPIELGSDGDRAHVNVLSTFGELSGQLHVMSFRKVQDSWALHRSTLLIQE